MKYDVHLYATVRVKVCNVEAESPDDALILAEASQNLHEQLPSWCEEQPTGEACEVTQIEFAEEVLYYLVDTQGDEDYTNSVWFHWEGNRLLPGANEEAHHVV